MLVMLNVPVGMVTLGHFLLIPPVAALSVLNLISIVSFVTNQENTITRRIPKSVLETVSNPSHVQWHTLIVSNGCSVFNTAPGVGCYCVSMSIHNSAK